MVKKLRCEVDTTDWVLAESGVHYVEISMHSGEFGGIANVFLSPENAKKLRKQIKKALVKIEGEDERETNREDPVYIPHVGEVVEVYRNTVGHDFDIGEKVRFFRTPAGNLGGKKLDGSEWWAVGGDIRPIQNWKPKEGEKVLIVDSTYIPSKTTRSWVGEFGYICYDEVDGLYAVYNEDKSDWFGFNLSDLRPAE